MSLTAESLTPADLSAIVSGNDNNGFGGDGAWLILFILFAMNGQTGKLIGDLPIDNGKVTKHFIMIFIPLAVIIALVIIFVLGGYGA